eukprot:1153451-Pelagomonas_calceolata.AAC.5
MFTLGSNFQAARLTTAYVIWPNTGGVRQKNRINLCRPNFWQHAFKEDQTAQGHNLDIKCSSPEGPHQFISQGVP